MTEDKHVHDYCLLFKQPKIREGILIRECDCGEQVEQDAQEFVDSVKGAGRLYLFDFNTLPEDVQ